MAAVPTVNDHRGDATTASLTETVVEPGETHHPLLSNLNVSTSSTPSPERSGFERPAPTRENLPNHYPNPLTIPSDHSNRTLVLCFDGTGDQFDADNSNIVQLFSLLKKDNQNKQMVYYQSGIGTYTSPQIATPVMSKVSRTLDEMVAWNLNAHVMDGYEFLMQNYIAGDRICIFGFSRGAYTARALAGMIHKVGLLPACNFQQVPFAYKMFTRADKIGWEQSNAFKKAFSIDVDIEFIGVWDTVDSVGLIPRRLPFTTSNTLVRTFRHALALDERRAKFKPKFWKQPTLGAKLDCASTLKTDLPAPGSATRSESGDMSKKDSGDEHILSALERKYSERHNKPTDVEEVWFSGCHCDIGGGSVSNKIPHSLARISLRWMIRECFKTKTGIMFDVQGLKSIGLDHTTLYPFVIPRPEPLSIGSARIGYNPSSSLRWFARKSSASNREFAQSQTQPGNNLTRPSNGGYSAGTEEEEELKDAMSPVYDQLKIKWFWWILEIVPMELPIQDQSGRWVSRLRSNLGHPRSIPEQNSNGVKVHRTVRMRMNVLYDGENPQNKKYSPRAQFGVDPTWVD